ncbi:SDR family oxidoreductase [Vulgatibacter sp.]|uniref:SDR family oxidoreductase n=1 Tax=Vulgatibacter sp. TaxID=1971226 RepID=UPI003566850D
MSTAFVTGATGYTGRAVVEQLRKRGEHVVAHVRPDSPELAMWRERFAALGAEVDSTAWDDEDAFAEQLSDRGISHLFHLVGTTKKRAQAVGQSATESYEKVDYGLTALLVRAAARSRSDVQFTYLSSLGASATSSNAYLRARGKAEEAVRQGGMPWVIVRPSFISGPDRPEPRPLEQVGAKVSDALLGVAGALGLGTVRDRFHSIDAAHLAAVLVHLAYDPAAQRHTFEPPFTTPID